MRKHSIRRQHAHGHDVFKASPLHSPTARSDCANVLYVASNSTSPPASAAGAPPAFEAALAQLESLVTRLESGDLPLDEALRTFEQGVQLTRECQSALSAAQQKVQQLLQRGETATIEDFKPSEDIDATARLQAAAPE